jgi:hypothetical protein
MATPDMPSRLKSLLPPSWFGDGPAPVRDAILAALGAPASWAYSLYSFVLAQARLTTSSGIFVDLFGLDFFGRNLPRRTGETDDSYIPRIKAELIRPRNTRAAMSQALTDLTGTAPTLFEPWNTGDAAALGYTFGVGVGAPLGSLSEPNQVFITVKSPGYSGVPNIAGVGTSAGGVGVGALATIGSQRTGGVTNAEIYATVLRNVAAGVRAWVKIT